MHPAAKRHPLITGTVVTSLGTLASRILGMFSHDRHRRPVWAGRQGVADAFLFAFRIPNLFRQLFGEGALTASYLPVLTAQLDKDPRVARQLASVVVTLLAVLLTGVVLAGELLLGLIWMIWGDRPSVGLLTGLSAVMLPYLTLICVAAQLSTMLYAARHFTMPALAPTMLSIVWLIAAWLAWQWFPEYQVAQAYVLAAGVVVAGIAQVAVQTADTLPAGLPFRLQLVGGSSWPGADRPQSGADAVGLGRDANQYVQRQSDRLGFGASSRWPRVHPLVEQRGALSDEAGRGGGHLLRRSAQRVSAGHCGHGRGGGHLPLVEPPCSPGRSAAIGRRHDARPADRLLSGGASRRRADSVGRAHRAVIAAARVFQPGRYQPDSHYDRLVRIGRLGVLCITGGRARLLCLNDSATPARITAWIVGLNLTLNLTLIWPMAEAGLAASTSVAAAVQTIVLMAVFSRRHAALGWRPLAATAVRTILATLAMAGVVCVALAYMPDGDRLLSQVVLVGVPVVLGAAAYCASYWLLGGRELGMLIHGRIVD